MIYHIGSNIMLQEWCIDPKRAVYKTLGLVRLHLSSLHSCSPEKRKTCVTVRQFTFTEPTLPIHCQSVRIHCLCKLEVGCFATKIV